MRVYCDGARHQRLHLGNERLQHLWWPTHDEGTVQVAQRALVVAARCSAQRRRRRSAGQHIALAPKRLGPAHALLCSAEQCRHNRLARRRVRTRKQRSFQRVCSVRQDGAKLAHRFCRPWCSPEAREQSMQGSHPSIDSRFGSASPFACLPICPAESRSLCSKAVQYRTAADAAPACPPLSPTTQWQPTQRRDNAVRYSQSLARSILTARTCTQGTSGHTISWTMEAADDAAADVTVRLAALPRCPAVCAVVALRRSPQQPAAEDALLLRAVDAPAVARVTLSEKDKAQHVQLTDDGLGARSSKARAACWLA